ncbi:MAG: S-layer protein [Candidatus Diapherotrites archaeon]|mgnify:CR=1 FL=1|nr:S-layer protein [Candidatus Diapherotrites archaeon]
MKGLSIKKVVAIGLGAALVGSALAPVVSAANMTPTGLDDLTVDDVVSSAGVPVVDVVVGSNAGVSDVVWAGNIAARVAQLATTAVGGESGATSVDVTVGGVQTTVGSGNTDENTLSLTANWSEFNSIKADYSDSAVFANIAGRTIKNAAVESQINIDENVEVIADAKFQSIADGVAPGELVAQVNSGAYKYSMNFGTGIPYYTTAITQLDANANYNVKVPILGQEYTVDEATSTKLVLYADTTPTDLASGESVSVPGVGDYDGKTLTVQLDGLTNAGGTNSHRAKWTLYDGESALKTVEATPAYDLKDQFGSSYFTESVYVSAAGVKVSTGAEYATIRTGTQRLEIRNNQVFPYDSTKTTNPEWKAYFRTGSGVNGSNGTIVTVQIRNNWSYNQTKTESTSSKLMLAAGSALNLPEDHGKFIFNGLQTKPMAKAMIGGDTVTVTDTKGISREMPLVIALGSGSNTFEVAGNTYLVDVNTTDEKVRYWAKPTSTVSEPYNNPTGTETSDYFDVSYTDDSVSVANSVKLLVDDDWFTTSDANKGKVAYYVGADEGSQQFWLFLAAQSFDLDSKGDTDTSELYFTGTEVDQNALNGDPVNDVSVDLNFYFPDQTTYNVLTALTTNTGNAMGTTADANGGIDFSESGNFRNPSDGDDYQYGSVWTLNEAGTATTATTDINFYVNNQTGLLVSSTDNKTRLSDADKEVKYTSWSLDEYTTASASKLLSGVTDYGTEVTVADGVATIMMPEEVRKVEAYLGSSDTVTSTVGGEDFEGVVSGETVTTASGTEVTISGITAPSGNGVAVVPTGNLVKVDTEFTNGKSVIVGGWVANAAAVNLEVAEGNTLESMLLTAGDYVAAELTSGDIVVAGMTAADTGAAAQELINALDAMLA